MAPADAPARRSVLMINVDEELFAKLAPLLRRDAFEVDRFPRAAGALELISRVALDVLLVGYPLADIDTQELLDAVREGDSPCRRSPLLLLARDDRLAEAERFIGRGANQALAVEESAQRLQAAVSRLLAVAPRRSLRLMVRMVVNIGEGAALEMTQSENFSETGMLVRTSEAYPLGSRLSFELNLPGEQLPVRGEGEVVRQTTAGREASRGIGIQFLSFERDGLSRLQRYLRTATAGR